MPIDAGPDAGIDQGEPFVVDTATDLPFLALAPDDAGVYALTVGESRRGLEWPLTAAEVAGAASGLLVFGGAQGAAFAVECAYALFTEAQDGDPAGPCVRVTFPDGWAEPDLPPGLYVVRLHVFYMGGRDLYTGTICLRVSPQ